MRPILETLIPHVYRYALRLTGDGHAAEDLAQEAIVRAWQRQQEWNDEHHAKVWLLRVTANLWRDELRRREIHARHTPAVNALIPRRSAPTADSRLQLTEDTAHALALLDRLPPRQRDVLYLTVCEGLSPGEIASVLDISSRAVIASLSVARQKVRMMLDADAPCTESTP